MITMKEKIKLLEKSNKSHNINHTTPNIAKNNSTFNRLQEIQVLIKKESGLKELCMYNNFL